MPAVVDSFTVLTASSLTGAFANVANGARLDTAGGEGSFLVSYDGVDNAVVLSDFAASAIPGDYNGGGIIDAADYTVWRDAVTAGATELLNDPTPGTIDESDFEYWREHFGETLGSGAGTATAVPEPATLVMLLMASLAGFSRRSRQFHQLVGRVEK